MDPLEVQPGTWGVSHGSGWLGGRIRAAQIAMSKSNRYPAGDLEASWAGHAFVSIGLHDFGDGHVPVPAIVEAEWPEVVISRASRHPDARWADRQLLSMDEREAGTACVLGLVGHRYDWPVYGRFLLKSIGLTVSHDLTPLFTDPAWIICSGVPVVEQRAMGVPLGGLETAAVDDPSFVCPADLLRWGLDAGWMDH